MYLTEHPREADAEWIGTAAAVRVVALALNDEVLSRAQDFLVRRAAANMVLTRCSAMIKKDSLNGQQEWGEVLISHEFWARFSHPNGHRIPDWRAGDFSILQFGQLERRIETSALGVQFSKRDLLAQLPAPGAPAQVKGISEAALLGGVKKGKAGKPTDKKAWGEFSAALAVVAYSYQLGDESSASAIFDKVARVLAARLGEDAPHFAIDNVRDAITLAMDWSRQGMPD